jgi:hypothetical protein
MQTNPYQRPMYAASRVSQGRYPYPASYAYYPTRNYPYKMNRKPLYPLALVVVGIIFVVFGFMNIEKLDPKISRLAISSPDSEIVAVVFCDPCVAVRGELISSDRRMIVDTALDISNMVDLEGVKQIKMVGAV